MKKIIFGIIGAGWRSEFYIRIAKALPERFEICGILVRNEERGRRVYEQWGIKTFTDIDKLLKEGNPEFVVVSVPWAETPIMTQKLIERKAAVLTETPPAPDLKGLVDLYGLVQNGAKIQVAEQYQFQPLHSARIATVNQGLLGDVNHVQLSVCHGYHAMSLLRKLLKITFENAMISARQFTSPIVDGPGRRGGPSEEKMSESTQVLAFLDFGDKSAVYDFDGSQYFSWIRSLRMLVRGTRGEITDHRVRYLKDFKTPVEVDYARINTGENGNLEGYYLKGILAGDKWIYESPFVPGRLSDDEIAIATCLERMSNYVNGGPELYSVAEAAQDHYLGLMIDKAVKMGETIHTERQPWSC